MSVRSVSAYALVLAAACGTPSKPAVTSPENLERPPAGCDAITVDLYAGTVNGLPLTASMDAVKAALPCSTGESPEGEVYNYGGGVFFTDRELYLYTGNDFINVRAGFTGTLVPPLLTMGTVAATDDLGELDLSDEAGRRYYAHAPGCIVIVADTNDVQEVSVHGRSCEDAMKIHMEL